jgi:hypothetical protein
MFKTEYTLDFINSFYIVKEIKKQSLMKMTNKTRIVMKSMPSVVSIILSTLHYLSVTRHSYKSLQNFVNFGLPSVED